MAKVILATEVYIASISVAELDDGTYEVRLLMPSTVATKRFETRLEAEHAYLETIEKAKEVEEATKQAVKTMQIEAISRLTGPN